MDILDYVIQDEVGSGPHFVTYRATTPQNEAVRLQIYEMNEFDQQTRASAAELAKVYQEADIIGLETLVDYGELGNRFYVAFRCDPEETSLDQKVVHGVEISELLEVTRFVAQTLSHLYELGFSYGALQPKNVVVRSDRSICLRSVFESCLLRDIFHSKLDIPYEYQSPEQVGQQQIGLQGDWYALGLITYECLIGSLPWIQHDANSIRTSSQGVPPLPKRFRDWEILFRNLLAYDPQNRYQSVQELSKKLDSLRSTIQQAVLTSAIVEDDEISAVVHGLQEEQEERQESRRREVKRNIYVRIASVFVPIAVLVLLIYLPQTSTIQIWMSEMGIGEHPNLQSARETAAALRVDPNQSFQAIIGAYDDVLKYAPSDSEALAAKALVKQAWEDSVILSLDRNELDLALSRLNEVISVYPDDETGTVLFNRIQQRRQALGLLSDAEALFNSTGFQSDSATTVINLYKEVESLYPDNQVTTDRLNGFATYFANLSIEAAEQGEISQAMDFVRNADIANPDHVLLATAREALSAAETLQAEIDAMLKSARELHSSGNLIMPTMNNAASIYQQVLSTDVENSIARQGLETINAQVLADFRTVMAAKDFAMANEILEAAIEVGLASTTIGELRNELDEGLRQTAVAAGMVQEAKALYTLGYVTEPAEKNAVTILREALRFDPNNNEAVNLLQQCSARLARVAQDAHEAGFRDQAELYLELALFVTPNKLELSELQESWQRTDLEILD